MPQGHQLNLAADRPEMLAEVVEADRPMEAGKPGRRATFQAATPCPVYDFPALESAHFP
jgi:hypothetical protein